MQIFGRHRPEVLDRRLPLVHPNSMVARVAITTHVVPQHRIQGVTRT
jgi:hypothetical protein